MRTLALVSALSVLSASCDVGQAYSVDAQVNKEGSNYTLSMYVHNAFGEVQLTDIEVRILRNGAWSAPVNAASVLIYGPDPYPGYVLDLPPLDESQLSVVVTVPKGSSGESWTSDALLLPIPR
jgi:hypothetical protein